MEKKRVIPVWVSMMLVVLIAVNLVFSLWKLVTMEACVDTVFFVLNVLIDLCALDYCVMGYSKFGAVFFKLYCWLNIVCIAYTLFFDAISFTFRATDAVLFVLPLVELMLYFAFAVVPDLGRKKSFTLAGILSGAILLECIILSVGNPALYIPCVGAVVSTATFFIMVYAKYQDKAARGTK